MRKTPGKLLAYTAVPICLTLSILLAFCATYLEPAIPGVIVYFAFFLPQYLFSFSQVVQPTGYSFVPLFSPTSAVAFGVLLWLLTSIGFGLLARHFSRSLLLPIAFVAVIVVAIIVHFCFSLFGYSLQLDGP